MTKTFTRTSASKSRNSQNRKATTQAPEWLVSLYVKTGVITN